MVKQVDLNLVFRTLSDPTRRHILEHLSEAARPLSVLELAEPHDMSLPAISKHLKYLERADLIQRTIEGRTHRFEIVQDPLRHAEAWLVYYLQYWNRQLDQLERHLNDKHKQGVGNGPGNNQSKDGVTTN